MSKLYLVITADEYELPLGVYDSIADMARAYGLAYTPVKQAIRKGHDGSRSGHRFIRVEVP